MALVVVLMASEAFRAWIQAFVPVELVEVAVGFVFVEAVAEVALLRYT
jgi:hypothetical protein